MRFKIDENLPAAIAPALVSLGHEADTVVDEGLRGRDDATVWIAAQAEKRFLITQDLDFSDARVFAPGTHAGILLVRLPDDEQWRAAEWVIRWLSRPDAGSWAGCFVVASPRKIRVLRSGTPDDRH